MGGRLDIQQMGGYNSDPATVLCGDTKFRKFATDGSAIGVETYSDLKAYPTAQVPNHGLVITEGYWEFGDGGGARYVYRSDSTEAPNEPFVVVPDSGVGRYYLVHNNRLNVRWWGAKGDGTTDDSLALNACSTAAGDLANGTEVYIPLGTFIITICLEMHSKVNYRIHGTLKKPDGWGATAPVTGDPRDSILMMTKGSRSVTEEGLPFIEYTDIHVYGDGLGVLDGASTTMDPVWRTMESVQHLGGLQFYNVENFSCEGLTIRRTLVYALYSCSGKNGRFLNNTIRSYEGGNETTIHLTGFDVDFSANGKNQAGIGVAFSDGILIANNSVWSSDDAIDLDAGFSWVYSICQNITIIGNDLQVRRPESHPWTPHSRCVWIGVPQFPPSAPEITPPDPPTPWGNLGLIRNVVVKGNVCQSLGFGFMTGNDWSSGEWYGKDGIMNLEISGNVFMNIPSPSGDPELTDELNRMFHGVVDHVGIFTATVNSKIEGNLFLNFERSGIGFKGCRHIAVRGNMFYNQLPGQDVLQGRDSRCVTANIVVADFAVGPGGTYGVIPFRDNEDIEITGNKAISCVGAFISDAAGTVPNPYLYDNWNRRFTISGNKCYDMSREKSWPGYMNYACISFTQFKDFTIEENELHDCAGMGIFITNNHGTTTDDVLISGHITERLRITDNYVKGMGIGGTTITFTTAKRSRTSGVATIKIAESVESITPFISYVTVTGLSDSSYNEPYPVQIIAVDTVANSISYDNGGVDEAEVVDDDGIVTRRTFDPGIWVKGQNSNLEAIDKVIISGNQVEDCAGIGIAAVNCKSIHVRDNHMSRNGSLWDHSTKGNIGQCFISYFGIEDEDPETGLPTGGFSGSVENNLFDGAVAWGQTFGLFFHSFWLEGDTYSGLKIPIKNNTFVNCSFEAWRGTDSDCTGVMEFERPTSPPTGTHFKVGDRVWYTTPTPSNPPGALCTTATIEPTLGPPPTSGTPAVWKEMSPLAS